MGGDLGFRLIGQRTSAVEICVGFGGLLTFTEDGLGGGEVASPELAKGFRGASLEGLAAGAEETEGADDLVRALADPAPGEVEFPLMDGLLGGGRVAFSGAEQAVGGGMGALRSELPAAVEEVQKAFQLVEQPVRGKEVVTAGLTENEAREADGTFREPEGGLLVARRSRLVGAAGRLLDLADDVRDIRVGIRRRRARGLADQFVHGAEGGVDVLAEAGLGVGAAPFGQAQGFLRELGPAPGAVEAVAVAAFGECAAGLFFLAVGPAEESAKGIGVDAGGAPLGLGEDFGEAVQLALGGIGHTGVGGLGQNALDLGKGALDVEESGRVEAAIRAHLGAPVIGDGKGEFRGIRSLFRLAEELEEVGAEFQVTFPGLLVAGRQLLGGRVPGGGRKANQKHRERDANHAGEWKETCGVPCGVHRRIRPAEAANPFHFRRKGYVQSARQSSHAIHLVRSPELTSSLPSDEGRTEYPSRFGVYLKVRPFFSPRPPAGSVSAREPGSGWAFPSASIAGR